MAAARTLGQTGLALRNATSALRRLVRRIAGFSSKTMCQGSCHVGCHQQCAYTRWALAELTQAAECCGLAVSRMLLAGLGGMRNPCEPAILQARFEWPPSFRRRVIGSGRRAPQSDCPGTAARASATFSKGGPHRVRGP